MPDPELDSMRAISEAFEILADEGARGRVLRWAADKYAVDLPSAPSLAETDARPSSPVSEGAPDPGKAESYEHFAELYAAIAPKTDVDRALVAGYWCQVVKGNPTFKGVDVQKELTQLGHKLTNVTQSLSSSIKVKPQLVLQVGKSGSGAQARKTYKLSNEGVKTVESRLQ